MNASAWAPSRPAQRRALAHVGESAAQARGPGGLRLLGRRQLEPPARREQHRDGQERGRVGEQRRLDPGAGDHQAGDRRAARGADREGDVEQRVALAQLPGGREHGARRRPGQRPRGRGERAVERRQGEHGDEREAVDHQREDGERDRLGGVQGGQRDPHRQRLQAGDQRRPEQRRREMHAAEQRRGRHRAAGLVEDEDRERDLAEPVAELVDEIGEAEVRKPGQPQRTKRGGHRRRTYSSACTDVASSAPDLQLSFKFCKLSQVWRVDSARKDEPQERDCHGLPQELSDCKDVLRRRTPHRSDRDPGGVCASGDGAERA